MSSLSSALLAPLRQSLSGAGKVVLPSDAEYPSMTQSWNRDFTGRPSAVVWVGCTADVVAAMQFLRQHELPFTVGGGFHSRYSLRDGHVLISLGGMRKVTVDPTARLVRLQGGARNADLDAECAKYHLHTTAGTNPDTGCGGLVLGGGVGYLSRRIGMSIDQLVEVELVNADGAVMTASEQQHADLFWACKGAGFNFGVVTEFTMKVHTVGHQLRELTEEDEAIASKYGLPAQQELQHLMVQGMLPYPQPAFLHIMQVLDERYVQPAANGPMADRCLFLAAVVANGPHGPAAVVQFVHTGDVYTAYKALDRLIDELGAPLAPVHACVKPDTYLVLQSALDVFTPPGHYYERSLIAQTAPSALTQAAVQFVQRSTATPGLDHSAVAFLTIGAGGAVTDYLGNGAFSEEQRKGNWTIGVLAKYEPERITRARALEWANAARDAMMPYCSTHYTNSSSDKPGSRVLFSTSIDRLRQTKQKYDPLNIFCNNHNVVPATMDENSQQNAQPQDD